MRETWLNNPLRLTKIAVACIDLGALVMVAMIEVWRAGVALGSPGERWVWIVLCIAFVCIYPSLLFALGLYDHEESAPRTRHPLTLIGVVVFWSVLVDLLLVGAAGAVKLLPESLIVGAGIGALLWMLRLVALRPTGSRRQTVGVLLLGWDPSIELLVDTLQAHPYWRRSIIGMLAPADGNADRSRPQSDLRIPEIKVEDAQSILARGAPAELAVPVQGELSGAARRLLRNRPRDVQVRDAISIYQRIVHRVPVTTVGDQALTNPDARVPAYGLARRAAQRSLDILASVVLLILLAPLLACVAAGSLLLQGRPIFFAQERIGFEGKPFTIYKFRTMTVLGRPRKTRELMTRVGDPRLTQWGRILRRFHLDELPQFWNVLRGDMSLVGPRPISRRLNRRISRKVPSWGLRYLVVPGVTGWEQVCSMNSRNEQGHCERLERDLYYIEHASLLFDFYILMKTPGVLLRHRGAI